MPLASIAAMLVRGTRGASGGAGRRIEDATHGCPVRTRTSTVRPASDAHPGRERPAARRDGDRRRPCDVAERDRRAERAPGAADDQARPARRWRRATIAAVPSAAAATTGQPLRPAIAPPRPADAARASFAVRSPAATRSPAARGAADVAAAAADRQGRRRPRAPRRSAPAERSGRARPARRLQASASAARARRVPLALAHARRLLLDEVAHEHAALRHPRQRARRRSPGRATACRGPSPRCTARACGTCPCRRPRACATSAWPPRTRAALLARRERLVERELRDRRRLADPEHARRRAGPSRRPPVRDGTEESSIRPFLTSTVAPSGMSSIALRSTNVLLPFRRTRTLPLTGRSTTVLWNCGTGSAAAPADGSGGGSGRRRRTLAGAPGPDRGDADLGSRRRGSPRRRRRRGRPRRRRASRLGSSSVCSATRARLPVARRRRRPRGRAWKPSASLLG